MSTIPDYSNINFFESYDSGEQEDDYFNYIEPLLSGGANDKNLTNVMRHYSYQPDSSPEFYMLQYELDTTSIFSCTGGMIRIEDYEENKASYWDFQDFDYFRDTNFMACACGKCDMSFVRFVKNKITGIVLPLGSVCVKKHKYLYDETTDKITNFMAKIGAKSEKATNEDLKNLLNKICFSCFKLTNRDKTKFNPRCKKCCEKNIELDKRFTNSVLTFLSNILKGEKKDFFNDLVYRKFANKPQPPKMKLRRPKTYIPTKLVNFEDSIHKKAKEIKTKREENERRKVEDEIYRIRRDKEEAERAEIMKLKLLQDLKKSPIKIQVEEDEEEDIFQDVRNNKTYTCFSCLRATGNLENWRIRCIKCFKNKNPLISPEYAKEVDLIMKTNFPKYKTSNEILNHINH